MDDLRTRAKLLAVDGASVGADSIGTVVSRAEFAETAARGEFPATLLLDLDRLESGEGGEVTARARVAVDWDEDTLDQLLASTKYDEIALWFDARELAQAFDEVEGHGLRQKAAVLAITAAAAGASVTPASARVVQAAVGPSHSAGVVSSRAPAVQPPMGVERGLQMNQEISSAQAPSTVSGGSEVSTPSTGEIAGIAAGAALLIAAAGFGVARRRTPPAQPA
jgi:hypothetical protein